MSFLRLLDVFGLRHPQCVDDRRAGLTRVDDVVDHGVPGGENMMVREDGTVRYFSVRESARLQTFPDGYLLHGSWTEAMRQLGNAVPVRLAHVVAASVAENLVGAELARLTLRPFIKA